MNKTLPQQQSFEDLLAQAQSLVPLKDMTRVHLLELLKDNATAHVFRGQVLFEAGSYDQSYIYLLHGDIELQFEDGLSEIVKGRSALFPLVPLLPRPCRAIALSDSRVLKVDAQQLDRLLAWSQIADYLQLQIADQPDLDEDAEWMMKIVRSNLFSKVPPTNIEQIFSRLTPQSVDAGDVILRQGELGDGCYFIQEGQARVTQSAHKDSEWVADIGVGRCFGEDALVNETVRNATVTMATPGVLLRLEKQDFLALLREPEIPRVSFETLLKQSDTYTLIDVRTEGEYSEGHLEGAANIPVNFLPLQTRQLDKSHHYVTCCNSGRRSDAIAFLLRQQGFQVSSLTEGLRKLYSSGAAFQRRDYILKNGRAVPASSLVC